MRFGIAQLINREPDLFVCGEEEDASDALTAIEKLKPDLVIADYMMPVLDGAGLLRAMRETETHRNIPCIIMSAMPEANVRERIDGFAAFVRKPFQLTAVVQLVATIVTTSRPAS